jgi:transcriptional regulator with XRE-family HTH domain
MHFSCIINFASYIMRSLIAEVPMNFEQLGTRLREARRARHLSQQDLASPLGMSRATISAIEGGRCGEIGVRKLTALLQRVGLDLIVGIRGVRPTLDDIRAERSGEKDSP